MSANPYAYALAGRDPQVVIAETPQRLANVLVHFSAEQIEISPAPGKWSVRDVLAHFADCEIAFGFRLRQVYSGESHVQPFDQDGWSRPYRVYSAALAMQTFVALRAWNAMFLAGLNDEDKRLPAFHPERGTMTLWTIVETMAGHDLHHLVKLEALRLEAD